ncbi:hypothetical protein ACOMHN_035818 [Nucella lapillus]
MASQIGDRKRVRDEGKSHREMESPGGRPSSHTRRAGRPQRGYRPRPERSSVSPRLLDFAPDVWSKFETGNAENQVPARGGKGTVCIDDSIHCSQGWGGKGTAEESPFRSPLHKTWRGMQETASASTRGRRAPHNVGSQSARQRATRLRSSEATVPPQEEKEGRIQSNDSRVRKCLWADDTDEAFCEGDISDEPVPPRDPPKTPTKEQLTRRQKDIDYGKATAGYKNYLERVPRDQRGNMCPQTPDKHVKVARRVWDVGVRSWRRSLHDWDAPKQNPYTTPSSSPTKLSFRLAAKSFGRVEGMSPISSITSSPSDKGYVTTPDSRCDHSSQDLEEEEDYWLEAIEQFPPLPSSVPSTVSPGPNKPWWQMVEEQEKDGQMEDDQLGHCVEKLTIGNTAKAEEGVDDDKLNDKDEEDKAIEEGKKTEAVIPMQD